MMATWTSMIAPSPSRSRSTETTSQTAHDSEKPTERLMPGSRTHACTA